MKLYIVLISVAVILLVYAFFFMENAPNLDIFKCPKRQYRDTSAYLEWLKSQGLDCKVSASTNTIGGVPEDCDENSLSRTLFIICNKDGEFARKTVYETDTGQITDFEPDGGGAAGAEGAGASGSSGSTSTGIEINKHCHYMIFDDPFWYAGIQEEVGFNCTIINETSDVVDMTLVCDEFLLIDAQEAAGIELNKTTYFNCSYISGKSNVFPVYDTTDGRYVFFGELK